MKRSIPAVSRAEAGFTLLEMMVATMILGLVFMSVYGVVARALHAKNHSEERADLYAAGRETVLKMADDLEGALPPTAGGEVLFVGSDITDRVPTDALLFTTIIQRPRSSRHMRGGRAHVSYLLDALPGAPGLYALRRQEDLLTREASAEEGGLDAESSDEEAVAAPLISYIATNVAGLQLKYVDAETGELVEAWDTTQELQAGDLPIGLPMAVQITLWLADARGLPVEFGTVVDLPLMTLPPTPGPGGRGANTIPPPPPVTQ